MFPLESESLQAFGESRESLPLTGKLRVGVGVGVGVGVDVAVGAGVGAGVGFFTTTSFFHTNFLPDLMQVNLLPCEVLIWPLVVHLEPALIAAKAGIVREDPVIARAITTARVFFLMKKIVLSARS